MITRRIGTALTFMVLLSSGSYLLVYLYRWEWNRAVVAGIFFIAAEIALVATALLRRLRSIESRLDSAVSPQPLDRIREVGPEERQQFEWLDPSRMGVFVPVLLGAGVILSLLAHAVERIAGATTTPIRERTLALRLDALALSGTSLVATSADVGLGPLVHAHVPRAWRRDLRRGFAVVVIAFLCVVAIQVLADLTQDRPDAHDLGRSADVVLHVDRRFTERSEIITAEALFVACRQMIGNDRDASEFTSLGNGRVAFTITPSFGEHAQRKFVGCIEDALFDRISASVVSLRHNP